MTLDEMLTKVNAINQQVAEKNAIRNQSIGKRDTLAEKFSAMVASYKEKYGVDLSNREAMDAEIAKVLAEKEKETAILSQALSLIDNGKYVDAERLLTGTTEADEEIKRFAMERAQKEQQAKAETKEERAEVREIEKEIKAGNVTVATPDITVPNVPVTPVEQNATPTMQSVPVDDPAPVSISDELRQIFDTSPKTIPNQPINVDAVNEVQVAPPPVMDVPVAPPLVSDTIPAVPNAVSSPVGQAVQSPTSNSVSSAVDMFSNGSDTASTSGSSPILSGVDEFMSSMGLAQPSAPVASPMTQPSAPTAEKPKSFDAIFGGTAFNAGN